MDEILIPLIIVPVLFIGLPWLILHYVTKWKVNSGLTAEDETMLDDLYELARRLDERMHTIERIMQDENPNWRALTADREFPALGHSQSSDIADISPLRARSNAPAADTRGRI